MKPLLSEYPLTRIRDLGELAEIARAIETEAVRRYGWLAEEMARRGEDSTADTFRRLAEEEDRHVEAVGRWAAALGLSPDGARDIVWRLPADLASSWDEASASALLTPYRALAIAVDNEERTFSFYAYVAAEADDPQIAEEAEKLAGEELRHAALLRVWRRAAYHREQAERSHPHAPVRPIESQAALEAAVTAAERETAICHLALVERLTRAGDTQSARLLNELAAAAGPYEPEAEDSACEADACKSEHPLALLLAAQRPLERLAETLERVLISPPDEPTRLAAEQALERSVARIARIGRRIEELEL